MKIEFILLFFSFLTIACNLGPTKNIQVAGFYIGEMERTFLPIPEPAHQTTSIIDDRDAVMQPYFELKERKSKFNGNIPNLTAEIK